MSCPNPAPNPLRQTSHQSNQQQIHPFKLQPPLLSVSNKLEQMLHPRHFLKETVFEVRKGNLFMIHARNQILQGICSSTHRRIVNLLKWISNGSASEISFPNLQ